MDAVTVAAYACAEDGLGQVVADVEAELAPHLFPDAVGGPEVQLCAAEQGLHGLDTGAVAGRSFSPKMMPTVVAGSKWKPSASLWDATLMRE